MKQKSSLKDRLVGSRYFSFGITLSLFVLLYVVGMMNYRGFMKPQVFCNLLDNAAKHGGAGKRIDTAIFPDGNEVVITVRDYGPGIPPEELPNVKYKFYKGSSTARGSGIGLAVCEEIVSRHNGELIISNAEDEAGGCVVEVRLPTGT